MSARVWMLILLPAVVGVYAHVKYGQQGGWVGFVVAALIAAALCSITPRARR